MNIRTLTVELLRSGPRHNQLLSKVTQYLGICGNAAAGTVTLPYEHREMETHIQNLSYRVAGYEDAGRRQQLLDDIGSAIARMLSLVPGSTDGLVSEMERADTLTHVRIVLSASELAMLPFEVSKVPAGTGSPGVWLALQARNPVCITRHIRAVSAEGMQWPANPRILFVAGPDTPYDEHRRALLRVLAPWNSSDEGDRLVSLEQATVAGITQAIERAARQGNPFTHVHVLAHGVPLDDTDRYSPIGVALADEVINGRRLATALTSLTSAGIRRPVVVTLATCDSAKVADVRTPDASVAHDLHDQGIPLVVASQFPLSVDGSVPFVERFYGGELWGRHPVVSLFDVRMLLHTSKDADPLDWASVVAYEALPSDLRAQLEHVCYWQARRAQDRALKALETFAASPAAPSARPDYDGMVAAVRDVDARLPTSGPYALECDGLRAASKKRAALAAFQVAVAPTVGKPWRQALFDDCRRLMSESRDGYWRATKEFLKPTSEPMRRKANLHWLLGQVLSLDVVLGQPLDQALWTTAHLAARIDTEASDHVERAWAHVSLAELALLRLSDRSMADDERGSVAREVLSNIERVVDLLGRSSEHVMTTFRQFERYVKWWGEPDLQWALERLEIPERKHWFRKNGLVPTVMEAMAMMRPAGKRGRGSPGESAPPSQPDGTSKDLPSARPSSADPAAGKTPARAGRKRKSAAVFDVEMLPAENGDCLWIEYGDPAAPRRFLIDCGAESTAALLTSRVKGVRKRAAPSFELFILTHIDADHINGVVPLLSNGAFDARFQDIWFNGWRQINQFLSVKQAEQFTKLLENPARKLPWNRATSAPRARIPGPLVIPAGKSLPSFELGGGMRLTLLSPGPEQLKRLAVGWEQALAEPAAKVLGRKAPPPAITNFATFSLEKLVERRQPPDRSAPNGSSIAVLAEFDGRSVLLTGDAHADVLVSSIKRLLKERGGKDTKLKLDAIKLSHHGSANGTTTALLDVIDCRRYLVSSNGNIYYHPDREAIARVILHGGRNPELLFNYRSTYNGLWEQPVLRKRYEYRTVYPPAGTEGLRVSL